MIKAGVNDKQNPFILLGLTEGNIVRLKNGQPIKVSIASCGVDLPGSIGIVYGQSHADLEGELRQAGLFTDQTQMIRSQQEEEESALRSEYDNILVATVGLPRSGKTYWAKSQAWPMVNPDSVRLAIHGQRFITQAEPFVWATAKAMVRALFLAGHKIVILDACNTTRKRRDEWQSKEWVTFFKAIDTPVEVCHSRAALDNDSEIIPIIERMAMQFEPLGDEEQRWPDPA